jgi:hypothetical protein
MTEQKYSLTPNEKFAVWFTTMLMMTEEQLDHDSKARIMEMVMVLVSGEQLDKDKLVNTDGEKMKKMNEIRSELEHVKKAIFSEMDKIKQVLEACYGDGTYSRDAGGFVN